MLAFFVALPLFPGASLAVLEQHVDVVDLQAGELLEGALDVQQQSAEAGKVFAAALSAHSSQSSAIVTTHRVSPSPSSNL